MRYKNRMVDPSVPNGAANFLFSIRTLWRDMVTWGRAYMISRYAGLANAEDEFNRLYEIPLEFGNIFELVFGYENAQTFMQYLSRQIIMIRSLVEAQMAGDVNLANQLVQQLYSLADERAAFMASINPFWNSSQVRNLIYTFFQLTIESITTFLAGDYKREIDIYDRLLHHTDSMGDYLAQGILNYMTYHQQSAPAVQ